MIDREKVIKGLEICNKYDYVCLECPYYDPEDTDGCNSEELFADAIALLKEQEDRHRLEVHNIGNVDIPEGVSEEHFYLVMNNVVEALQHTDKGESYPYEDTGR